MSSEDEREGKPVARQLAPMISKFIRAQWESEGMENVNDERRQLLEEAVELDQIWGIWEGEEESTHEHHNWIRQPSQSGNDMRHHIEVHSRITLSQVARSQRLHSLFQRISKGTNGPTVGATGCLCRCCLYVNLNLN